MTTSFPAALDEFPSARPETLASSNPVPAKRFTDLGDAIEAIEARIGTGTGKLRVAEVTVTETGGAGTYTGSVTVPAGSTLADVVLHGVAVWDNAGAVTAIVGDVADDNGIFTGVNLKATDLTAGQTISAAGGTGTSGGKEGADIIATHWNRRYLATERVISVIVTTASTGGSAGRTRMVVSWYEDPSPTAATFAAA